MSYENRNRPIAVLAFLAGLGGGLALAQDAPPPTPMPTMAVAPQHVTVPSLPGEPNREGVVRPSGTLKTDAYGNLAQPVGGPPVASPTASVGKSRPKPIASSGGPVPLSSPGPAPSGPATVTGPNVAHMRGVVKAYEAGKSLTMTVRGTGRDVIYNLKAGAKVPSSLKPGDAVRIRVLTAEKGNVVNGVEILPKP